MLRSTRFLHRLVSTSALAVLCAASARCTDEDSASAGAGGTSGEPASAGKSGSAGQASAGKSGSAGKGGAGTAASSAGRRAPGADLDAGSEPADATPLSIRFAARVGGEPFACDRSYQLQGVTVAPLDLRFYVQDVSLVTRDGREVPVQLDTRAPFQTPEVALIDLENASGTCGADAQTNDSITGHVPAGDYTAIRFSNGVPDKLNHGDPKQFPPPLKVPGMSWSWLLGFRFLKAELTTESGADADAGAAAGGAFHLGSTGCSGNPSAGDITCKKPNRNRVQLDGYQPGKSVIVLDLARVFGGSDLSQLQECHSASAPCESMFASIGVSYATGAPADKQSAYRLETP